MNKDNCFYMVLGSGEPTCRHYSVESAKKEAERLARLHRGSTFVVLQSIAAVKVSDLEWTEHDGGMPPF